MREGAPFFRKIPTCIQCVVGILHPWHDGGEENEAHVEPYRKENPVFDKDKEARDEADRNG